MDLTQTHARFADTSQTLLLALQDPRYSVAAATELTRIYWPPVYAYLRHSGINSDQAAETTQAFFADKVFGLQLFDKADQARGRVRNLILASLKNFVIDQHRKDVVRGKGQVVSIEAIHAEEPPQSGCDPSTAFDQRWASAQLEEAMRRCETHFYSSGRIAHWTAFTDRIYHPSINNTTPTALKELAPKLGFSTAADAAAAVQLVKKRAVTFLREVITESTEPGIEAEAEFKNIIELLQVR